MKNTTQQAFTRDMTSGSVLCTILAFALPLFIGNIFQQVYSIADTMIAGYYIGDTAIAAIGATASLYNLIVNGAVAPNMGYGIIVTRCFGAHDDKQMKQSIAGMLILNAAAAVLLTALSLAFLKPLLRFMNTPESFFPALAVLLCLRMAMQAMGQKAVPVLSSCIELGMKLLSAAFVIPRLGFLGTSITEPITWVLMMFFLLFAYVSHRDHIPPQIHKEV